ncbi:MAG: hypothetical protein ACPL7D_02600 [Candidatus Sumerlaeaceae bacterium]|jgi:hypothetical protein
MNAAKEATPIAGSPESGGEKTARLTSPPWVERLAERICERDLSAPAIFLFEAMRPLNFVASQTMHALAPLASLFVERRSWEEVATALEDRGTLELLLAEIEKRERERSSGR